MTAVEICFVHLTGGWCLCLHLFGYSVYQNVEYLG